VYAIQLPSGERRGEPTSRRPAKSAGVSWAKIGRDEGEEQTDALHAAQS